jgi:CBS domain containing-hemolysin-like protein
MELTLGIIGLILSFFFAGSETAFITTSKIRLELWIRNRLSAALFAQKYFRHPEIYLSTTLVGNNIANILASSYATVLLIQYIDETLAWAIITLTILTFGEIVPKVLFRTHAHSLILKVVYLIRLFHIILNPIIFIAEKISSNILQLLKISREDDINLFHKRDIEVLLREAKLSGVVDEDEHKIITRVLSLPEKLVREAMIPRTLIQAIEDTAGLNGLRQLMIQTGNTKIPVYKDTIDNIIGVVFFFDLLSKPKSLKQIIKPITFTPENKKCNELLREFRQTNTSIAIVIDEYGGTAGIITTEDLIEKLFGDFEDTPLTEIPSIRALNRTTWQVHASESIDKINEELNINIPPGNYETLSGFILARLGHIPKVYERIELRSIKIVITRASKNRVEEARIIKSSN